MFTLLSKDVFFDGRPVEESFAEANRRVFTRFGGYVRKVAKNSIKPAPKIDVTTGKQLGRGRRKKGLVTRDAISQEGKPPYAHTGRIGATLAFAFDLSTQSEVIGPGPYGNVSLKELEEGGEINIGPRGRRKGRRVTLGPRPFMVPAFQAGVVKLPEWYRDSMRK